jgi:DNA polymerase
VIGKSIEHGEQTVVASYHPSFALRALDSETRRRVYDAIVAALQAADKLIHQRKRSG